MASLAAGRRLAGLTLMVLALLLGGCGLADRAAMGSRGAVKAYDPKEFGAPDPMTLTPAVSSPQIGPLDVLTVTVFQVPDISGDRQVNASGQIEMPLLGLLTVSGRTAEQVRDDIQERLGAKYMQNPHVEVAIKQSIGQRYTVEGSVRAPGVYPIEGPTTLLQAIAVAKGMDDTAVPSRVAIFRTVQGKRLAAGFDVSKIRKGLQPDPTIYGNDLVVIDGSNTRSNYRDLLKSLPLLAVFGVL